MTSWVWGAPVVVLLLTAVCSHWAGAAGTLRAGIVTTALSILVLVGPSLTHDPMLRWRPAAVALITVGLASGLLFVTALPSVVDALRSDQGTRGRGDTSRSGDAVKGSPKSPAAGRVVSQRDATPARLLRAPARGTVLDGLDLAGQPLDGLVAPGGSFVETDLRAAQLSAADLRGADLSDADLRGAVLRGACLAGARLDGAKMAGADLAGADIAGAEYSAVAPSVTATWPAVGARSGACD